MCQEVIDEQVCATQVLLGSEATCALTKRWLHLDVVSLLRGRASEAIERASIFLSVTGREAKMSSRIVFVLELIGEITLHDGRLPGISQELHFQTALFQKLNRNSITICIHINLWCV